MRVLGREVKARPCPGWAFPGRGSQPGSCFWWTGLSHSGASILAVPPSWQPSAGRGGPANRLSASHMVGVILGYGGRRWGSQVQGPVLQESLVSPRWDTLPLSSPESPSWADFRWPVRVAAVGEAPFLQDGCWILISFNGTCALMANVGARTQEPPQFEPGLWDMSTCFLPAGPGVQPPWLPASGSGEGLLTPRPGPGKLTWWERPFLPHTC